LTRNGPSPNDDKREKGWKASAVADCRILFDTGPLVALLAASDAQHRRCVETFAALSAPLLTCWPVLIEALGCSVAGTAPSTGSPTPMPLECLTSCPSKATAFGDIAAIMRRYEEAGLQLADAALAYLAEREDFRTVFTLDRRDFSIIRLKRDRTLRLIPDIPRASRYAPKSSHTDQRPAWTRQDYRVGQMQLSI